ncbi:uncharacterized protein LOC144783397 [Lissotriton helveticus]
MYYRSHTGVIQEYYSSTTGVLHENYRNSTGVLQKYYRCTTGIPPEVYRSTAGVLPEYHRSSTGVIQEYYRSTAAILQEYYMRITGFLQAYDRSPPRGKRTEKEEAVAPKEEDAGQGGECSFAGPSGTSGGGASSDEVVVIDSDDSSGEEAAQEQTVRKQTVAVVGTVGHTKTTKPTRSMQAVLARQRRLDATVAQYRRLVKLEGDDTQSSTSNVTSASSSVTPRSAGQRSAPAKRSRAGRRHRRAAKAAPHSTVKARLRRAIRRVSDLEAEVRKWKEYQNLLEGLRLDHATLREQYDALALRHDALEAKVNNMHP